MRTDSSTLSTAPRSSAWTMAGVRIWLMSPVERRHGYLVVIGMLKQRDTMSWLNHFMLICLSVPSL